MKKAQNCLITLCKYIISVIQYNYVMFPMNGTAGSFGDGNHFEITFYMLRSHCVKFGALVCSVTNETITYSYTIDDTKCTQIQSYYFT